MNPWLILIAVLAVGAAGGAGYVKGSGDGQAKVQAAWDAERIRQQEAHARALQESIEKQQALQLGADQLRQEADREKRELAARNTALTNSLRNRPERPAESSTVSSTAGLTDASGWCTGARLYREHAEAFAGESALAAELQSELKTCLKQYEAVRLKLGGGATAGK